MQIKRIALGGIIMTVIMFTPTYACVGASDGNNYVVGTKIV